MVQFIELKNCIRKFLQNYEQVSFMLKIYLLVTAKISED